MYLGHSACLAPASPSPGRLREPENQTNVSGMHAQTSLYYVPSIQQGCLAMLRFSLAIVTALTIAVVGSIAWDAGQRLDELWRRSGQGAHCARLPGPPPSYTCTVTIEAEPPLVKAPQ